jgi:hypothetical protein
MEGSMTMVLFWIWGILGLLINGMNWLSLSLSIGGVGVGSSSYAAAGNLFWIGGMVLFGLGAVIIQLRSADSVGPKLEAINERLKSINDSLTPETSSAPRQNLSSEALRALGG